MKMFTSRKSMLMSGTAALAILTAVAGVALAADISVNGHQNLINAQENLAPSVQATSDHAGVGSTIINGGSIMSARIDIAGHSRSATAIGNAGEQAMNLDRTDIELEQQAPYSEYPYYETAGAVAYAGEDTVVSNGALNVLNSQITSHGSIRADGIGTGMAIGVSGDVDSSAVSVVDNASSISARGNDADNALSLKAANIATVAGVNNLQISHSGIDATLGSSEERYEIAISVSGDVSGSTLSISDNSASVATIGNRADNALALEAATLRNGGFIYQAVGGHLDDGIGADGTFVIANMQRFDVSGADGVDGPGMSATAYGSYLVETEGWTDSAKLVVDGNNQSARIFGNAAANALSISAVSIEGGGELPAVAVALSSDQTGDGDLTALSHFGATVSALASQSTFSISGNENIALARMNEASNTMTIEAATIDGSSYAGIWDGSAYGDHIIFNNQTAEGAITSLAETAIGNLQGSGTFDGSAFTVESNLTASEATANRSANALSISSAAALSAGVALGNQQTSGVKVQSTVSTTFDVASGAALNASVAMNDDVATALAHGNVAENTLTLVSGSGDLGNDGPVVPMLMSYNYTQPATAMLSNMQDNQGSVTARTIGTGSQLAFNCDCTDSSMVRVTGNSAKAAAHGNIVFNAASVTGGADPHLALVMNTQTNSGAVTAEIVNAVPAIVTSGLHGSNATMSGNVVSAVAIGNQAVNSISTR